MRTLSKWCSDLACTVAVITPALAQEGDRSAPGGHRDLSASRGEPAAGSDSGHCVGCGGVAREDRRARIADLQSASPSLSITDAGQTQSVNIRGIGLASNSPNATAGVATYVDGLFQPPIVQSNSFYDLAGVEVLRGPQGTLVGTNSTGGAIFINSAGESGRNRWLCTRRFRQFQRRGGRRRTESAGGATRWRSVSRVSTGDTTAITVTSVRSTTRPAGCPRTASGSVCSWKPGSFSALLKLQVNDMLTGGYAFRPILGTTYAAFRTGDEFTLSYDAPTSHREKAQIASLELKQELPSGILLRSLTGYQYKRIFSFDDLDGSAGPGVRGRAAHLGLFRGRAPVQRRDQRHLTDRGSASTGFSGLTSSAIRSTSRSIRARPASRPTSIRSIAAPRPDFSRRTNYALSDALELQVGARYSTYKATGRGGVFIGNGIPVFPPGGLQVSDLAGEHEDQRATGKVALNWKLDADNLLYGFVARGYKPGGFNSVDSGFDPETVLNYEVGWKSTFLEGRMRTQLAAFYNDYSDFQFDVLEPATGQGGIRNVASGTIKGFEAQLEGRLGIFGFDGGAAYVDSNLDGLTFVNERLLPPGTLGPQCPAGATSAPPVCFDYRPFTITTAGGPNLYSPKWTYNVGAELSLALGADMSAEAAGQLSHVGSRFTYLAYSPRLRSDRRLRCAVGVDDAAQGNWFVEAYGTNLTDETYVSGQAAASRNEFYGAPRQYGMRVGADF